MRKFLRENWILLSIILVAILLRFWNIANIPGGLFPDEAANGLDVNSILHGHLQPFFERGNGREALFFYFLALSVMLFGRGAWQLHIVTPIFGIAEILATYFLVKRLFGKRVAYLAAFFYAVSSYAVSLNHNAFRANLIPLFTVLTFLFLVKVFQTENPKARRRAALAAGISFALGFYTYIAYRMMIPLLFGLAVILLFAYRQRLRETLRTYSREGALFILGFAVTISPLAYYFLTHPGSFVGRAGEVSIFSKNLNNGNVAVTALGVFRETILGFFTQGDQNWRHNVSGFPFLSPFLSPFFAVSLAIFTWAIFRFLWQAWRKKLQAPTIYLALVGIWFWFMLAPELTTAEGIPHGLRLIGVIPPLFILPAWSADKLWGWFTRLDFLRDGKYVLAVFFLGGIFFYNVVLFYGISVNSPDYYYAFRADLTDVSRYLNERNRMEQTYLSLDAYSVQTVQFLTTDTNQPYTLVDPAHTFELTLKPGDQVIFTQSTLYDRLKFLQSHPKARLLRTDTNQFGQINMLVYQEL